MPKNFVALIDSGVGGLTVLQKLQQQWSCCNFVYVADEAYCPYGTKSFEQIFSRVSVLVEYLQNAGAAAVVLACNTASVFADSLRAKFSIPIYDVIVPTCKLIASVTNTKRVALLATNATVNSGAYSKVLNGMGIEVVPFACSSFVPFVEHNLVETPECQQAVSRALSELPRCNVDTVVLGCTHFPLLKNKIAPFANGAQIVECCTDFQPSFSCFNQAPQTLYFTTCVDKNATWGGKNCNFDLPMLENISFAQLDL